MKEENIKIEIEATVIDSKTNERIIIKESLNEIGRIEEIVGNVFASKKTVKTIKIKKQSNKGKDTLIIKMPTTTEMEIERTNDNQDLYVYYPSCQDQRYIVICMTKAFVDDQKINNFNFYWGLQEKGKARKRNL